MIYSSWRNNAAIHYPIPFNSVAVWTVQDSEAS